MKFHSFLFTTLFVLITSFSLFAEETSIGVVSDVENDVYVVYNLETKKCTIGMFISKGSKIITKEMSRVKIMMMDDSLLVIAPKTEFSIDDYVVDVDKKTRRSLLGIIRGKVMFYVNKAFSTPGSKFEVKTKSSIAGVRGTRFFMESDEKEFLGVIDGEVELKREDKSVVVTKGKCFDSEKGLVLSDIDSSMLQDYKDSFRIRKGKTQLAMINMGTGLAGEGLLQHGLNGGVIKGKMESGVVLDKIGGGETKADSHTDRGGDFGEVYNEDMPRGDDLFGGTDINVSGRMIIRLKILLPFVKTKR